MNSEFFRKIFSCKKGATAIEYGLVVALIVVVSMGALKAMSSTVVLNFNNTSARVSSAMAH